MRILYYDCFAGISGDMNLGALIDLGVDVDYLRKELTKLNIDGFRLDSTHDMRRGISGTKATVVIENQENEKHRHLRHVEEIVNNSTLADSVKKNALAIFRLIAEAEARVHNIDIQKVHFHEVGALDSIADIVGAAICLDYLNVDKVLSAPIQLGGGTVKCAHGVMPVPAPATALIVKDIPIKTGLVQHEATTPTGAAILASTVDTFTETIDFPITKTAYGIGHRDHPEVPNILRVYLSETNHTSDTRHEKATVLECNIDDMNPEHYDFLLEKLLKSGAMDAWLTPILMKKNRHGNTLSVLCAPGKTAALKDIIFMNSTTIGLREVQVDKTVLRREATVVHTKYGEVKLKNSYYNGNLIRQKPEYDDCKKLAEKHQVSIQDIEREALKHA